MTTDDEQYNYKRFSISDISEKTKARNSDTEFNSTIQALTQERQELMSAIRSLEKTTNPVQEEICKVLQTALLTASLEDKHTAGPEPKSQPKSPTNRG
ncbi:MAG: hypothetical protein HOI53_08870 [Francisellaceae bacterium]|jgi:NTP pyrophosphatase (non-canonical NTP hydrolase)|nr:hypothetical protein [Francisellaceae bacterium]MBT6208126.1 hypothetical protein [Francisellaceae bacterium]MBT6539609.1 hypothetical protein [Francisellaceae bacterium]